MRAPAGEVAFDYEGKRYTLVFDMKAIAFFEREADISIVEAFAAINAAVEAEKPPKISHLAYLMQAGLQRHHAAVTAEDALAMAADPVVQESLGVGLSSAMPSAEGNVESPVRNGTGTKASKRRLKQG